MGAGLGCRVSPSARPAQAEAASRRQGFRLAYLKFFFVILCTTGVRTGVRQTTPLKQATSITTTKPQPERERACGTLERSGWWRAVGCTVHTPPAASVHPPLSWGRGGHRPPADGAEGAASGAAQAPWLRSASETRAGAASRRTSGTQAC